MQNLEELIKKSLSKCARAVQCSASYRAGCPVELELAKYLEGSLTSGKRQDMEKHLADCPYCLDLLVAAKSVLKQETQVRPSWFSRLKRQRWLILTAVSFSLSFVVRRFFLQFLFLALISGIKWALGSEGSRNLVMIFRSLSHRGAEEKEEVPKRVSGRK